MFLLSISLILILGLFFGYLCSLINIPKLIGYLLAGIILGPYCLNLLDLSLLNISLDIRKIALIIILTKAGLQLDLSKLKSLGLEAILMSFIPATLETIGVCLISYFLLDLSILEGLLLGATLAAVSPAVVVPRMSKLIDESYGTKKPIPQLILAASSVDDVYVIVLFTTFLSLVQGGSINVVSFVNIPVSIILGIAIGVLVGVILYYLFKRFNTNNIIKIAIIISISLLLVVFENKLTTPITFASLISIMFIGITLNKKAPQLSSTLSKYYSNLWIIAEVFLFSLVGSSVNLQSLSNVGVVAVVVIVIGILFRMLGVFLSIIRLKYSFKEKLFTMISYTPKATVQAAIGSIAYSLGLECGEIILVISALSIILTAPIGAFAIDLSYKHLLEKPN